MPLATNIIRWKELSRAMHWDADVLCLDKTSSNSSSLDTILWLDAARVRMSAGNKYRNIKIEVN